MQADVDNWYGPWKRPSARPRPFIADMIAVRSDFTSEPRLPPFRRPISVFSLKNFSPMPKKLKRVGKEPPPHFRESDMLKKIDIKHLRPDMYIAAADLSRTKYPFPCAVGLATEDTCIPESTAPSRLRSTHGKAPVCLP